MRTITTLLCVLVFSLTHAQWNTDTAVNTIVASSELDDMKALGTSTGETYVVFWKPVAAPTNYELRMQILDADGNQTLGSDGMLLSDQVPMSTYTVIWNIVLDADDNLYVSVTGTGGGDPAFVFKLDNNGNHLWGANGVSIGSGNITTVLPLSSGEAIVSWLSSTGAVMQKYSDNGTAVWPTTQTITSGSGTAAPANFFEIAGGEYIAVFHQLLFGISSYLYAQRYDVDGNPVWANATQIADKATTFNSPYKGVQDGDVVYMGYYVSSNSRFDSYLQRINPDGSLPWGINGSDFDTSQANFETNTEIAFNAGSEYIWSICRATNSGQSMIGEYVQKFDKNSGDRLFTDNAKVVFAIGDEKEHAGKLHILEDTPWFLIKNGFDNGATPITLEAVYLDENGEFAWPEETKPVATFTASKSRIHYTAPVNGQSVAVFVEDKGDGRRAFAQNMEEAVACTLSISCPSNVTVNTDSGVCTASGVSLGAAMTNGCAGEVITNDAPAVFSIGETIVTWTVNDGATTETCTQLVVVEDATAPVITCPVDETVEITTGSLYSLPDYFATGEATAIDNCTNLITITSQDPSAGTELAVGTHEIELTAADEYGNESTCSFELTVETILAINDQALIMNSITMFPNPAINIITFSNPNGLRLKMVTIYDVSGRLVKTLNFKNMGVSKTFDISEMSQAIYFVVIEGEEGQLTKQLIKM